MSKEHIGSNLALEELKALEARTVPALQSVESKDIKQYIKDISDWTLQYYQACKQAYPLSAVHKEDVLSAKVVEVCALVEEFKQQGKLRYGYVGTGYKQQHPQLYQECLQKVSPLIDQIQKVVQQQQEAFEQQLGVEGFAHMSNEVFHIYAVVSEQLKGASEQTKKEQIDLLCETLEQKKVPYQQGDKVYTKRKGHSYPVWYQELSAACVVLDIHPKVDVFSFNAYEYDGGSWVARRADGPCSLEFGSSEGYGVDAVPKGAPLVRGQVYQWSKNLAPVIERSAGLPIVVGNGLAIWGAHAQSGQARTVQCIPGVEHQTISFENQLDERGMRRQWCRLDGPSEARLNLKTGRLEKVVWGVDGKKVKSSEHPYMKSVQEVKMLNKAVGGDSVGARKKASVNKSAGTGEAVSDLIAQKGKQLQGESSLKVFTAKKAKLKSL